MKILQIVTLVTPEGAYGGPVRVAVNQTRALLNAGHDVTLAAGARGFPEALPDRFDDVPVRLFEARTAVPGTGFAGLYAPELHRWLRRESGQADVVHIHLGRDLITLPCANISRSRNVPYVLQTHGMIMPSKHPLSSPIDAVWTKNALQNAARVFYLTSEEKLGLQKVGGAKLPLQELGNGVPLPTSAVMPAPNLEVLFLARLHLRKRPLMFVEMAARLHERFPHARFSIVGPDEGQGDAVLAAIDRAGQHHKLTWEGALEPGAVTRRIDHSAIYVLPSVDEPFPMTVLEAMALGKPVVVTDTCGLAQQISASKAGLVVNSSLNSLIEAVGELLSSQKLRAEYGANAKQLAQERFSMKPVASQLTSTYAEVSKRGD